MLQALDRIEKKLKRLDKFMPPKKGTDKGMQKVIDRAIAQLPDWGKDYLDPHRFKVMHGGRGGGKSITIADLFLIRGLQQRRRYLCAREYQTSIKDSVHALLADRIEALDMQDYYTVQRARIFSEQTGTDFLFKGVALNITNIKSIQGVTDLWLEEAQSVSSHSWKILVPTIREKGSEIWCSFNPDLEDDPVYQEFVINPRPNALIKQINWRDNVHFPDTLEEERAYCEEFNPDEYRHIWEGELWSRSSAVIFNGKFEKKAFIPYTSWLGPYYGGDFGFSQDPCAAIECYIHDDCLWIYRESYEYGLTTDSIAEQWMMDLPGVERTRLVGDSSRPDTIDYLKRHGLPWIEGAVKGKGSVEDGIEHMRSFKRIYVHPNCPKTLFEFKHYKFKEDPKTEEITPKIIDKHNHSMDSIRYALERTMRAKFASWIKNM